jgi:hypothetical protein
MFTTDLTQAEIDRLGPEDYSYFLAFGHLIESDDPDSDYADYLKSYLEYDL